MIFVDTNVFMYAVGREHPLRKPAQKFFDGAIGRGADQRLATSAEVLQELLHAYLPVQRMQTFDAALQLIESLVAEVWPVDAADVALARQLADAYPSLDARDLLHLATCKRRDASKIKTYDRALAAAFPAA